MAAAKRTKLIDGIESEQIAEWATIDSLKIWKKNPRVIGDHAVEQVARAIKRFGFTNPILLRKANREVAAGHVRLRAVAFLTALWAKEKGTDEEKRWHREAVFVVTEQKVPIRLRDMTEREAHMLALADNKLHELAVWDDAGLALVVDVLKLDDWTGTGFLSEELSEILKVPNFGAETGSGRLDESTGGWKKVVTCPKCKHEFKA